MSEPSPKPEPRRTTLSAIEAEFLRYRVLGEKAMAQLDERQLTEGAERASSVATIVWHIAGNLESRFTDFLESDGEKPWRDRESEFEPRHVDTTAVRAKWDRGWSVLSGALATLTDDDLSRTVHIRGAPLSVLEALLRSLAHTSHHVGQIVYVAKGLRGSDWRFLSIPPGGSAAAGGPPA